MVKLAFLVSLLTAASLAHAEAPTPTCASVTLTGRAGMDGSGGFALYKLHADTRTSPHAIVPAEKIPGGAEAWKSGKKVEPLAFEGRIDIRMVEVGQTGSIPPGIIRAPALDLHARSATLVDDQNSKDFPAENRARLQGRRITGKFKIGPDKDPLWSRYAIENGDKPIILLGPTKAPAGLITATGLVQIDPHTQQFMLVAESIKRLPKKSFDPPPCR